MDGNGKDDLVYYFAYGSNMASSVLSGRRQVFPKKSFPVVAPRCFLAFDTGGFYFKEPCFASLLILEDDDDLKDPEVLLDIYNRCSTKGKPATPVTTSPPECHGVLHLMTRTDFERVERTEGGGGMKLPDFGYHTAKVQVRDYEGTEYEAFTLVTAPLGRQLNCQPSLRYKNIIVQGAKESVLSPQWIQHLQDEITIYEPWDDWVSLILAFLWNIFWFPARLPMMISFFLAMRFKIHLSPKIWYYYAFAGKLQRNVHTKIWVPLTGVSGSLGKNSGGLQKQTQEPSTVREAGESLLTPKKQRPSDESARTRSTAATTGTAATTDSD